MTDLGPHTKRCLYCGRPVSVSAFRCPHCGRSLAAVEQEHWEQSDPSTESSDESYDATEADSGIQISPAAIAVCLLLIAGAATYGFSVYHSEKQNELPEVFTRPVRKAPVSASQKSTQEETSYIRIHEAPGSAVEDVAASTTLPGKPKAQARERTREEKIQEAIVYVLEDLRQEQARESYTVRLTSGREIKCDSVSESDTQVTIKLDGLTATFDRESIESIEHQSAEAAAEEMEHMALRLATQMVDQGMVRHGSEWITPEEKAREELQRKAREEPHVIRVPKELDVLPEEKADRLPPQPQTDEEKLQSLLSLIREKKVVDADFFGGTLHIEDRSDEWPGGEKDDTSIIAFEAQAERINLVQLSEFLKMEFSASGRCEGDVDGGIDQRDPTTLAGEARVTCSEMTIPPIDLSPFLSPLNRNASLSLGVRAEDGIVVIEGLRLIGSAYNVAGGGTVRIATKPEQSPINGRFRILLKEAPTLVDGEKAGTSMQYVLQALAGSGTEIDVTLSGPVSEPDVKLVADSAIGSIAFQLDK